MWCCIAGKPVASILKALWSSKMSGTNYLMMYYNVPEGLNLRQHCYKNLKFCNSTQHCRSSPPPPPHHSHHNSYSLVSCAYPDCSLPWPLQSLQANAGTIQPLSCHCTYHSQLSHTLSLTVLSCPVTPLHIYCFLLLCCNWPKFLHLQTDCLQIQQRWPIITNHLYGMSLTCNCSLYRTLPRSVCILLQINIQEHFHCWYCISSWNQI